MDVWNFKNSIIQQHREIIKSNIQELYGINLEKGGVGSGRHQSNSINTYLKESKKKMSLMSNRDLINKRDYHELKMTEYDSKDDEDYLYHNAHADLYKKELYKRTS